MMEKAWRHHWKGIGALLLACMIAAAPAWGGQSTVVVADGMACMGYDKSRKQTEQEAMNEAKRNASEKVSTQVKSMTLVKDAAVESDLIQAFAQATVKLIELLDKHWAEQEGLGSCYQVRIQAEVIPQEDAIQRVSDETSMDDPRKPLKIKLWTDHEDSSYRQGEHMVLYLQGNKPFYARVIYRDVTGTQIQLLPNPYRRDNYFQGGTVYRLPSGEDRFDLEVSPPFGAESITVYASTQPVGSLSVEDAGSVYMVNTPSEDIGIRTRGIKLVNRQESTGTSPSEPAEFAETAVSLETRP